MLAPGFRLPQDELHHPLLRLLRLLRLRLAHNDDEFLPLRPPPKGGACAVRAHVHAGEYYFTVCEHVLGGAEEAVQGEICRIFMCVCVLDDEIFKTKITLLTTATSTCNT